TAPVLARLAEADCFAELMRRREALWEAKALTAAKALPLFDGDLDGEANAPAAPGLAPGDLASLDAGPARFDAGHGDNNRAFFNKKTGRLGKRYAGENQNHQKTDQQPPHDAHLNYFLRASRGGYRLGPGYDEAGTGLRGRG
ncbi:MAG: hypothetical protein QF701_10235, partial [Nitrospinota bacterium]|nr:hypothetical protein [Nitrospinota bacterium]